jgi:CO/xanthine dehydrogenase Mo-binding subunit
VLTAAAEHWGWQPGKGPSGRGLGVACGMDAGSYVTAVAEIGVKDGKITLKRMLWVQEMGQVINPEGAKIQMEGGITMGLGYALSEEIHFKDGVIRDTNFDAYALPRFSWLPKIETVIVQTDDPSPYGGGEPAIILTGAVIANAFHDATGIRLLELPMSPDRIRAALASKTANA